MRPEGETVRVGQIYVAAVGTEINTAGWSPVGVGRLDSIDAVPTAARFVKPVKMSFILSKKPTLGYRSMLRLFGFQPPSLIHNGKKRRK